MINAGGFIVIRRQIKDWEWYKNTNTFCLFIHLLLMANYENKKFEGRTIRRGQFVTSLPNLSKQTGLSIQQVRTSLSHLISTGEITSKAYPKYRVITISNYDRYQDKQQANQQAINRQSTGNLTGNQQQHNNNNKYNKGTNNNVLGGKPPAPSPRFIPPSVDQVRAYCEERKNGIDPERFVDYYETRGWILNSGQKMKNWKAAVRNWERRDRDGRRTEPGAGDGADRRGDKATDWSDYSFLNDTVINL